jgi:hypothetical protein
MAQRPRIFWLCLVVVMAIMVLASSLHEVRFEPGPTFAPSARLQVPNVLPTIQTLVDTPVWKIVVFWLASVAYLILFLLLLPRALRKRILRQMLSLALGVLALVLALRFRILQLPSFLLNTETETGPGAATTGNSLALPDFRAPFVTPWMAYAVSLAVLWAFALLFWLLYRKWQSSLVRPSSALSEIEDIARASLGDLAAGRHWADVVVEAYGRMSYAVGVHRGLERHHAATPREFADRLTRAGMPADAVVGLTRLFESVRYGGRASSQAEVKEAVTYLESILHACGASA